MSKRQFIMNDEEKLMLFERKLLNISRRCSLVELSRRKIMQNLDFYQEHEQYGRKLKSLPVCLRDSVLREFTSLKFDGAFGDSKPNFERKLQDFSFLLSSETKEIELDGLLSFCPREILHEQLTRVVQMIAAEAPNVQSLIINGRNAMTKILIHHYHTLDRASIEAICSLSKLKKLKISMSLRVEFSDLMKICETLQLLEYVDITIDNVLLEFSTDKFKRSFSRLKVFLFSVRSFELRRKLIRFCIQHLPRVRLLNYLDFTIKPVDFDSLKLPSETSSLMNLCVYPTTLPIHQHFPEVRHLTIGLPQSSDSREHNIDTLLHFSKLESIYFEFSFSSEKNFNRLLDHYGLHLRRLHIANYNFKFRMEDIMNRCKRLEKLTLFGRPTISDEPLMPTQTFAELKELKWEIPILKNGNHLLHLLFSPKLEKVTLTLNEDDELDVLKEISNLIANGQILGELKSLKIHFDPSLRHEAGIPPLFKVLNGLIKNACAFLPKFTRVIVKPIGRHSFAPFYNSQGEFEGFRLPTCSRTEIFYNFGEFGQANLAKFLFACRTGKQL